LPWSPHCMSRLPTRLRADPFRRMKWWRWARQFADALARPPAKAYFSRHQAGEYILYQARASQNYSTSGWRATAATPVRRGKPHYDREPARVADQFGHAVGHDRLLSSGTGLGKTVRTRGWSSLLVSCCTKWRRAKRPFSGPTSAVLFDGNPHPPDAQLAH